MESKGGRGVSGKGGGGRSASSSSRSAAGASGGGRGETARRGRGKGQGQAGRAGGRRSSDSAVRKGKRPARSSPGRGSSSSAAAIPARGRPTTKAGNGARRGSGAGGGGGGGTAGGGDSYANLGTLISKATKPTRETGYKRLDEDIVRRIKAVAKTDDHCAAGAIRYLMQRMAAKSAEVRFMALSIVGVLFQRSKVARKVVVADLKNFMDLAVGHDARQPLPGPPIAAAALRQKALSLMEEWNGSHGDLYKGLRAAYRFLREGKRMKFPELQAMAVRERQAAARRGKHAQRLLQAKYLQAKAEITEQAPEIETMVREMQECFAILVPAVPGADAISTGQGNSAKGARGAGDPPKRDDRIGGGWGDSGGGGGGNEDDGGGGVSTPLLPGRVAYTPGATGDGDRHGRDGGGDGNVDDGGSGGSIRSSISGSGSSSGIGGAESGGSNGGRRRRRSSSSEREKTGPRGAGEEGGIGGRTEPEQGSGEAGAGDGEEGPGHVRRNEGEGDDHSSNKDANDGDQGPGREAPDGDEADSDEDEGMEWEEGGGGGAGSDDDIDGGGPDVGEEEGAERDDRETNGEEGDEEEEEEEEEELWRNGKRRRVDGGVRGDSNELRTIADTVEAAGLGSSGYELQVEVPMGWSVTAGDDGDSGGGDTSLVVSALRERYKVMTSRLLPLLSDWIQTLGRVHFDDDDYNHGDGTNNPDGSTGSTTSTMIATTRGGGGERRHAAAASASTAVTQSAAAPGRSAPVSVSERRACAGLLGRCLAMRNSANTLVSKFIELRLDEDGAGRGGGEGLGLAAPISSPSKKKRLKIQLDGPRETGKDGVGR